MPKSWPVKLVISYVALVGYLTLNPYCILVYVFQFAVGLRVGEGISVDRRVGVGVIWACKFASCFASFWVWKKKNAVAEIVIKSKTESKITAKLFFFGNTGWMGGTAGWGCGGGAGKLDFLAPCFNYRYVSGKLKVWRFLSPEKFRESIWINW